MSNLLNGILYAFIDAIALNSQKEFRKLAKAMNNYDHPHQVKQDFATLTIDNEAVLPLVENILDALAIPETMRGRYRRSQMTLLQLFTELGKINSQYSQLINNFVKIIHTKLHDKKDLIDYLSITLPTIIICLSFFLALGGWAVLSLCLLTPVAGLIYSLGAAIYAFYESSNDKTVSFFKYVFDNLFLIAATALNVLAYILMIKTPLSSGVLVPVLFVAATAIYVVKAVSSLLTFFLDDHPLEPVVDGDSLDVQQSKIRALYQYYKRRNSLLIDLASSACLVGVVAFWSFFPGGILVALVSSVAMGLVYLLKSLADHYNENKIDQLLLNEFEFIETSDPNKKSIEVNSQFDYQQHEVDGNAMTCEVNQQSALALSKDPMTGASLEPQVLAIPAPASEDDFDLNHVKVSTLGLLGHKTNKVDGYEGEIPAKIGYHHIID
ncbi:MAG: hypothetical protein ACOVQX_06115 [Legionella sp.]